jgi:hypothetical protein
LCLICKENFCDGASLANHKNVEHNLVHFCPHCYINFPDQEDLSDHMRTMHKPTLAYMSGPGETVCKVIRTTAEGLSPFLTEQIGTVLHTSSDEELLPFLTEQDGVCSKCKKNGHISATCPNPQIANIPDEFLKAFPKSKEAYEDTVATGHYNKDLVNKWDYCLMAYMKAERKLKSAPPTAVIPPRTRKRTNQGNRNPRRSQKKRAPWDSPNLG